jgi:hypothetical protein
MTSEQTAVQAWERALAVMQKLRPRAELDVERCHRLLEQLRAGGFLDEVEEVARDCAMGFLNALICWLCSPENTGG